MAVDNVCIGLMIFLALILLVAFICAMCMSSSSTTNGSKVPGSTARGSKGPGSTAHGSKGPGSTAHGSKGPSSTENFTNTMVPTIKDPGLFIKGPKRMINPWNLKPMGVKPPQPLFKREQNIVFPKKVKLQADGAILSNETPRFAPYTVQYLVNGYGGANTRLGTNLGL